MAFSLLGEIVPHLCNYNTFADDNCGIFYKMRVAIITTVDHNVGDDFVREGIKYLLRNHLKNQHVEFQYIHKHSPITSRYGFEWFRIYGLSSKVDKIIPLSFTRDRIVEADWVVQSGAPVYWCHDGAHCYSNEWYSPLIEKRFVKSKNKKLLNLAAGTCQKYHSDGSEFCDHCKDYIKAFSQLSSLNTVRDSLAKVVLKDIGISAPVIPCSSIFAIDEFGLKNEGNDYVAVNYMRGGAHYIFGQKIDSDKWENEFSKFYFEIKKRERVVISCHSQKEFNTAKKLDPSGEIFFKKNDYGAYMRFYSRAKYGIMNRVHGALMLASFGKPSIVIGNDSRVRMANEIGLETLFVNDADYQVLMHQYEYLKSGANNYKERFIAIKEKAYEDYMKALSVL